MRRLWIWLFEKYVWFLSDKEVQRRYMEAGGAVGDAFLKTAGGETIKALDFESARLQWGKWEEIFASRGFRPLPIYYFIRFNSDKESFKSHLIRMEKEENPVFHARDVKSVVKKLLLLRLIKEVQEKYVSVPANFMLQVQAK
jgi:hypothetical protein